MSRKAYISDNLINMRERLRRNYEDFHRNQPVSDEEESASEFGETGEPTPPETVPVPPTVEPSPVRYMPSMRKNGADPAAERERRFHPVSSAAERVLRAGRQ